MGTTGKRYSSSNEAIQAEIIAPITNSHYYAGDTDAEQRVREDYDIDRIAGRLIGVTTATAWGRDYFNRADGDEARFWDTVQDCERR